mgnify:CR=1 FL=1
MNQYLELVLAYVRERWIAALAVQHRLPVASRDAHFDHVRGLRRVAW